MKIETHSIRINNLRLPVSIGVFDWEKKQLQEVEITLTLKYDATEAIKTDHLQEAWDYTHVAEWVKETAQSRHFNLIEHLAGELKNTILQQHKCSGKIEITKFGVIPNTDSVSFILEWL